MSGPARRYACVVDDVDLPPLPDPLDIDVRRRRGSWRRAAVAAGRPSTVVLDIGGVLVPSLFESVRGTDTPFPAGPLARDPHYSRVEAGEIGEREYWQTVQDQGWDVEQLWRRCSGIRSSLWQALVVAGRRLRLVAFTNDMGFWFGPEWLDRFPELSQLDAVVEAGALGVLKPDPESFRLALAAIGERPGDCLMVDDHPANLDGAAAAGMATLHFDVTDPQGSVEAFRRRLALPALERSAVFRVVGAPSAAGRDF